VQCTALVSHLDEYLKVKEIRDHSCNGLQIQGPAMVKKIALAVDFCAESARKADELSADLMIVHHGLIWGGLKSIRDITYERVRFMMTRNLGLYAAHLPLDVHPLLGNNAQLAKLLNLKNTAPFGFRDGLALGVQGEFEEAFLLQELQESINRSLATECRVLSFGKEKIKKLAIVSGGAAWAAEEAIESGCDAYLTGESSHNVYHTAIEGPINIIYAGHYASETPGVKALGNYIEETFAIPSVFVDVPTGF
jgi:dinuclear metal center YbgI/SA1388 family protein